ncbi:MAG: DNA-3-methyladenine glycosylase [Bacteroidales bacterium]|nr:DNA-3-methyladenine glycosylase [Bacteroidales bacterium]
MTPEYFLNDNVVFLAKDLLGKYVFTMIDGQLAGGMISETEAYCGTNDRASHAFGGRRTKRNEMMYARGGVAYIYLCYGMHHMLNFVTNGQGTPDAVLIRGIIPTHGEELMLRRTGKTQGSLALTDGPGKVCKALGINMQLNGVSLNSDILWVEDRGVVIPSNQIAAGPRIGVDYAGEDAKLPWRFFLQNANENKCGR